MRGYVTDEFLVGNEISGHSFHYALRISGTGYGGEQTRPIGVGGGRGLIGGRKILAPIGVGGRGLIGGGVSEHRLIDNIDNC